MPILKKLVGVLERKAYRAAGEVSIGIERRLQVTDEAFRDVVEFTKHETPCSIRHTFDMNLGRAYEHPFGEKEVRANLIYAFIFPKWIQESFIAHELTHMKQAQIMARAIVGDFVKAGKSIQEGLEVCKGLFGNPKSFDTKYFEKIIEKEGTLQPDNPLYHHAVKLIEALKNYNNPITNLLEREAYDAQKAYQKERYPATIKRKIRQLLGIKKKPQTT